MITFVLLKQEETSVLNPNQDSRCQWQSQVRKMLQNISFYLNSQIPMFMKISWGENSTQLLSLTSIQRQKFSS